MSLPAAHRRNQQAVVKMVEAKGLSLRGGRRPTWQSREGTCSSYKPPLKWCVPIVSVAALRERHAVWQSLRHTFCGARLPSLSLRGGRRATWRPEREARGSALGVQSREGSYVFAGAFLLSTPVLRDCRVASLLAMTIRGPVPFYRQPVPTVSSAPGGACPSPTVHGWMLLVTLRYPLSIFHLHHAAPTTTALIRIGGGGHFLHICLTGARTSCSCGAGGGPAPP